MCAVHAGDWWLWAEVCCVTASGHRYVPYVFVEMCDPHMLYVIIRFAGLLAGLWECPTVNVDQDADTAECIKALSACLRYVLMCFGGTLQ